MVRGEGSGRQQGAALSKSASRQDVGGHLRRVSSSQPSLRGSTSSQLPSSRNRHRVETSLTPPSQRGGGGGGRGSGGGGGGVREGRECGDGAQEDQSPQQEQALSSEETKKLVAEVMRHMLFKSHQQPNIPVRREELIQLITKTYNKHRYLSSYVISIAKEQLLATFGLQMREFTRMKSLKASKSACSQVESRYYVLQSVVPEELYKKHVQTPAMAAELSLAVLVVGILKFSGGENVLEEVLFRNLERIGIREGSDHPVFGDIRTALDILAKQRYIQKEKIRGNDGDTIFSYELAERARDLTFTDRLDAFTNQIAPGSVARGLPH